MTPHSPTRRGSPAKPGSLTVTPQRDSNGWTVYVVQDECLQETPQQIQATKHLLESAPALLAACQEAKDAIEKDEQPWKAVEILAEAIASAEGRT